MFEAGSAAVPKKKKKKHKRRKLPLEKKMRSRVWEWDLVTRSSYFFFLFDPNTSLRTASTRNSGWAAFARSKKRRSWRALEGPRVGQRLAYATCTRLVPQARGTGSKTQLYSFPPAFEINNNIWQCICVLSCLEEKKTDSFKFKHFGL